MSEPINISGSRAAAVLGLSKYQTPVQVWLQICEARRPGFCQERGYKLPVEEEDAAMRWGSAFENAVIELAERKQNDNIVAREHLFFLNNNKPNSMSKDGIIGNDSIYLTCHVDGLYQNTSNGKAIHEGKTTNTFAFKELWGEPGTDKIPQEYQVQVQHNLLCTSAEKCIVSVLVFPVAVDEWEKMGWLTSGGVFGGLYNSIRKHEIIAGINEWATVLDQMGFFHQYEIKADKKLHKKMLAHYADFWNNYVIPEIEPPVKDYEDIRLLCPEPVGTIVLPPEIEAWKKEYNDITKELGESGVLAKRKEQLKVAIGAFLVEYAKQRKPKIDDDSKDKFVLKTRAGDKIGSFNGKTFR